MTIEMFLILLTAFSVLTSLFTEAVKKFFDSLEVEYASNIIALIVAVFVGGVGTVIFYLFNGIELNLVNTICVFLMMGANWLGSMIGYDKVKQAIIQLSGGNSNGN